MRINDRLKTIGDLVKANSFCLDIGCDHAFLDIYLVKKNIGIKAIASDVAQGPLDHASQNIQKDGLEEQIEVRIGDGLDTYSSEVDTIIISGMGGRNMIGIFKNNLKVLKDIDTIIVSPNNYQEDVKRFLCKNGFIVDDEIMVREKKFIYQIIKFVKGKKKYSKQELFFGPILLKKNNKLFQENNKTELEKIYLLLKLLPKNKIIDRYKKIHELEDESHTWTYHDLETHVSKVINDMEIIFMLLKYDEEVIEEAKIAALLHDTGCLDGRENHDEKSEAFAIDYFKRKNIKLNNEGMIFDAIRNHSNGFDSDNVMTLAIVLADKLDMRRDRMAKWGYDQVGARQYQYITNIDITKEEDRFIINFTINEGIDLKELEEFKYTEKFFKAMKAFCKKVELIPEVLINNERWNLFYER